MGNYLTKMGKFHIQHNSCNNRHYKYIKQQKYISSKFKIKEPIKQISIETYIFFNLIPLIIQLSS